MIKLEPFPNFFFFFTDRAGFSHPSCPARLNELLLLKQVHGDHIVELKKSEDISGIHETEGDGIISQLGGVAIGVKSADCLPILIAHPSGVVAAIHAGWRGTAKRIIKKAIEKLTQEYSLPPQELKVAMGPAICSSCYEVGEEVADQFSHWEKRGFITSKGRGKFLLDLKKANALLLKEGGISRGQINISEDCTRCLFEQYNSYRGAQERNLKDTGRNHAGVFFERP